MKSLTSKLLVVLLVHASQLRADEFQDWDRNKDGKLSLEEVPQGLQKNFDRVDANHDGFISREEHPNRKAGPQNTALPDTVKSILDILYADTTTAAQRLDLYFPAKPGNEKPLPVIVFIHGGAWMSGNKNSGRAKVQSFVSSGRYAAASVEYRLSREARWPAQIEDCKAAIRWIKGHAKEHNFDPEKIAVWGTSAGGHLVAMLGVSGGVKELEGTLGKYLDQNSRVACVADYFGPTDLLGIGGFPSQIAHNDAKSPESQLIGGPVQENKDQARSASPVHFVSRDDAPTFLAHGTDDKLVPFQQSVEFEAALKKSAVPVYMQTITGGGHGGFEGPELNKRLEMFFDKYLRGVESTIPTGTLKVRE
jgi:acetyl esterase/lipase